MFIMPWLTFLIGEVLGLSGIVAIIFCGVSMAHYGRSNLSSSSEVTIHNMYHAVGSFCENLIFVFIGIGLFGFNHGEEPAPENPDHASNLSEEPETTLE